MQSVKGVINCLKNDNITKTLTTATKITTDNIAGLFYSKYF